jgi:hypothetical protein
MQASTIRSDIIGTGHVPGDDLADAALALDDPFGLDGGIEVEVFAPSRPKSAAVALPLPQPGPLEPAPETSATFSLSRSPMLSSQNSCTERLPWARSTAMGDQPCVSATFELAFLHLG